MPATRQPTGALPSEGLRATILDHMFPLEDTDLVAELRRVLARTHRPAAELWEQYRGSRHGRQARALGRPAG